MRLILSDIVTGLWMLGHRREPMAGKILYSGPLKGLQSVERSVTRHYIDPVPVTKEVVRTAEHWLRAKNVTRNNIQNLDVSIPWAFSPVLLVLQDQVKAVW